MLSARFDDDDDDDDDDGGLWLRIELILDMAQSAGAAEYTNCVFAEG